MSVGSKARPLAPVLSLALLAALAAWLLVGVATNAIAQEPPAATHTLTVDVGIAGYVDPAGVTPVNIELTSEELLIGRLEVRAGGKTVRTEVEVPAGGAKRYALELPPVGRSRSAAVALYRVDGDTEERVTSDTIRLNIPSNAILVGVVGVEGVDTLLRSSLSTPIGREVVPIALTPADLEAGPGVLPYLVLGPGSLDELSSTAADRLERWIGSGGRVFGPSSTVSDLGPVASGGIIPGTTVVVARVGEGEVGALEDPAGLSVEAWGALLRDVPLPGTFHDFSEEEVQFSLLSAATAGRSAGVPALPWLLAGILLFVVLVGPVNFIVLRAFGKPEAAWLTVPALSLLFVFGFWIIGRGQVDAADVTQASVLVDELGSTQGAAGLVLQTKTGGDHELTLPTGWSAYDIGGGFQAPSDVKVTGERTVLKFELEDLGVGAAEAHWIEEPIAVSIGSVLNDKSLELTVRNDTGWEFWAWGFVVNGRGYAGDGVLSPGGAGVLTATITSFSSGSFYDPVISNAVFRRGFGGEYDDERYTAVSSLGRMAESMASDLRGPKAYFYGFTTERRFDIEVDGGGIDATGSTLVVKHADLDSAVAVGFGRIRPEILAITGASSVEAYFGEIYAYGADEVFFRYVVPDHAPATASVSPGFTRMNVVDAYDWELGEFVGVAWGNEMSLSRFASSTGEVVLRAAPEDDSEFFDESLQIDRFALKWGGP